MYPGEEHFQVAGVILAMLGVLCVVGAPYPVYLAVQAL